MGASAEDYAGYVDMVQRDWGGPLGIERRAPSVKDDEAFCRWWARFLRMSASPGAAAALLDINRDLDLRHVLPAIRVPTLVMHAVGDQTIDVRYGRYLAARIPGARYVELPGADHLPWLADAEAIGAEIERFVAEPGPAAEPDRVLVTVMVAALGPSRGTGPAEIFAKRRGRRSSGFVGGSLSAAGLSEAGSTILATFDGPARAVRCASAIVEGSRRLGGW